MFLQYILALYICIIGLMSRVFGNGSGDLGFNPRSRHTKNFKNGTWYLFA